MRAHLGAVLKNPLVAVFDDTQTNSIMAKASGVYRELSRLQPALSCGCSCDAPGSRSAVSSHACWCTDYKIAKDGKGFKATPFGEMAEGLEAVTAGAQRACPMASVTGGFIRGQPLQRSTLSDPRSPL